MVHSGCRFLGLKLQHWATGRLQNCRGFKLGGVYTPYSAKKVRGFISLCKRGGARVICRKDSARRVVSGKDLQPFSWRIRWNISHLGHPSECV